MYFFIPASELVPQPARTEPKTEENNKNKQTNKQNRTVSPKSP